MDALLPFFWILLLSFFFQTAATKLPWLRIPSIIAYILFGLLLGNGVLPFFHSERIGWLDSISKFGLFYLMFLSGLEIDLRLLRLPKRETVKTNPFAIGFLMFLATAGLSFLLALLMKRLAPGLAPWMMMLILSTTSLGIVLPILKEQGLIRSLYGQTLLTAAVIADLITMLLISIAADLYRQGMSWRQFSVGLLLPLCVACYLGISRFQRTGMWKRWFQGNAIAKIQAVLALLGLFGVATDFTGSEPILGSFLAGILLACFRLREDNKLREQLELVGYSFVIPLFFVMVGAHFQVADFFQSKTALAWVPFLLVTAYAVKLLPMLWFGQPFGLRSSWAGGLLLSSRMTLVIVAASIGMNLGVIPRAINDAMLVVAVLTCTLSPILFTMIHRRQSG